MNAIEVQSLSKTYGEINAVQDVTFNVRQGEIFSLLGPNGAGKTTTLSMLSTLLQPESGDAWVLGQSIRSAPMAVKAVLGVVPQEIALYEDLSAHENLVFWGKMFGLRGAALKQRVNEVLEIIGLAERQKDRVSKFSGGMKRRVNIGVALLHRPKVIYMDEPTVGIDPQSRRHILDNVLELNRQGMSVLYTTHYMEEAQEISHRIGIMDHGKLIAEGTHHELVKIIGQSDRISLTVNSASQILQNVWRQIDGVQQVSVLPDPQTGLPDGHINLLVEDSNLALPALFESANANGARITSVEIQEPNLESVFLHLTGRALRD